MQFDKEQFFRSVCAIVAAIHAQRYVHADIHRGNIMVKSDNPDEPFVIDFDSAERIGSEISRQSKYINYLQNKIFEPKVDMVFLLSLRKQHQLDGSILAYYGGYTHATGCNIDTCGLTTGDAMDRVC
ncbi:hypothetical protein EC988_002620 [Linderina pennispora]|nr:hypothetical protein EC988_002620 [Linderina pennispora]